MTIGHEYMNFMAPLLSQHAGRFTWDELLRHLGEDNARSCLEVWRDRKGRTTKSGQILPESLLFDVTFTGVTPAPEIRRRAPASYVGGDRIPLPDKLFTTPESLVDQFLNTLTLSVTMTCPTNPRIHSVSWYPRTKTSTFFQNLREEWVCWTKERWEKFSDLQGQYVVFLEEQLAAADRHREWQEQQQASWRLKQQEAQAERDRQRAEAEEKWKKVRQEGYRGKFGSFAGPESTAKIDQAISILEGQGDPVEALNLLREARHHGTGFLSGAEAVWPFEQTSWMIGPRY
jgi:hypothetical protein